MVVFLLYFPMFLCLQGYVHRKFLFIMNVMARTVQGNETLSPYLSLPVGYCDLLTEDYGGNIVPEIIAISNY